MPIKQRTVEVRYRKLCVNCLQSPAHSLNKCPSRDCKICNARHNILLYTSASSLEDPDNTKESKVEDSTTTVITHSLTNHGKNHIMLSMAVVNAVAYDGTSRPCRVLLDSGSQANFISREFMGTLGLQRFLNVSITDINNITSNATQSK
ncbi:PREDICTED: uncharacterized protein LOC105150922 [Acromyrmex echinatior]|uniref:uncharacterized protein LOC105150922 n=1 Tax=Acromyrmex echinatior TaxID=103372 RepID=UPI0005810627|nr:PREDICTED: uncharacterized protein LOC105150922 [Acromyrmex echinatior]